jgi:hypothetical protein
VEPRSAAGSTPRHPPPRCPPTPATPGRRDLPSRRCRHAAGRRSWCDPACSRCCTWQLRGLPHNAGSRRPRVDDRVPALVIHGRAEGALLRSIGVHRARPGSVTTVTRGVSGPPAAPATTAGAPSLRTVGRVGHYGYVSSRPVSPPPPRRHGRRGGFHPEPVPASDDSRPAGSIYTSDFTDSVTGLAGRRSGHFLPAGRDTSALSTGHAWPLDGTLLASRRTRAPARPR